MDFKNLSDEALHDRNIQGARQEREVLTRLLYQYRETERRRLFSKHECDSMFSYLVKFMKYSNDQADRRVKAMRLLQDIPEVEEKITSGALNLTNLALAQRLFAHQKKSGKTLEKEQKIEVLARLENHTTRAAEKIVYEIQPELKPKKNPFDFNSIEDDALREKILQVKGRYAHSHPNMTLIDLLHKLCDKDLAEKTAAPGRAPKMDSKAEIDRQVWRRDHSKCRNCGSTHALQIEHCDPKAVGGPYTLENLCLLCRSCNQRRAIEYYGMSKMQKFLKSPVTGYRRASDRVTRGPTQDLLKGHGSLGHTVTGLWHRI